MNPTKVIAMTVAVGAAGTAFAQGGYRTGEQVELNASGDRWQRCVVTDPGSAERMMRLSCEAFDDGTYRRAGGVYTETVTSSGVRRATSVSSRVTAAPPRAPTAVVAPAQGGGYRVGQAVEIEASKHWVPCTVASIDGAGSDAMIRVRCPEYAPLSRGAGIYIVHDNRTGIGIRPATGRIGPAPVTATPVRRQAPLGTSLQVGEYACYGAGSRIMAGLAFKVTAPGRYTDLAGGNAGTFTVTGGTISFRGGHLGGQLGRELRGKSFRIGAQASCERWD